MGASADGWYSALTREAGVGTRYRYRIDRRHAVPDPASRFQPQGVHGPSEVVDSRAYRWRVPEWVGRSWREAVVYELHVGAFTPAGSFAGAIERLPDLAALGITALEIMPVAAFPGARDWGYDGVLPFAPQATYGEPDELRALVDAAHGLGIMVLLDVVYNHFGPEGNYLGLYANSFFTDRHHTPWGQAINFDGERSRPVRDFFIQNALYWLEEFRMDGLRLDAVHAILDDSHPDILEELADAVAAGPGKARRIHLVLENYGNEAHYLKPSGAGARYAAQWNDDFHHASHVLLTGERDGYYADYGADPSGHLARCLAEGFAYQGETSIYRGASRGEPSASLPPVAFINFLQNHDQVGNRAFGERLTTLVAADKLRVLTSIMLLAPSVPGLFMGEEFGCERPFLFFCDFAGELAAAVKQGRRREFARFSGFETAAALAEIPDPNAAETFDRSKIDWAEARTAASATWLALHRNLLAIRHREIVPALEGTVTESRTMLGARAFCVRWRLGDRSLLSLVANLSDEALDWGVDPTSLGRVLFRESRTEAEVGAGTLPAWTAAWFLDP